MIKHINLQQYIFFRYVPDLPVLASESVNSSINMNVRLVKLKEFADEETNMTRISNLTIDE